MGKSKKEQTGKPVLVVEIGNEWLKLADAESTRSGVGFAEVRLEKFESMGDSLTEAISKAIGGLKLSGKSVIACLPRQMVNVRMLELPSRDPVEIEDMISLQAAKQVPYSPDEIIYDYKIIGPGKEGYTRVMLAIAQRSIVRQRYQALEDAGIEVDRMSISTEGVLNWFGQAGAQFTKGTLLLLDVDSYYADFMVLRDGALLFTRSILIGADGFNDDYAQSFEKLVAEVRQSLNTFRHDMPDLKFDKLLLSGADACLSRLGDDLARELGIPYEKRECLKALKSAPKNAVSPSGEHARLSLTPLVGLAVTPDNLKFNLVPDSVRLRKTLVNKARGMTLFAVMAVAALFAASMYAVLKVRFKEKTLAAFRAEVVATAPDATEVARKQEIVGLVERRMDPSSSALLLLAELHPLVPKDVYFESIGIDNASGQMVLDGTGASRKDIRALVKDLEQSPLFRNVREGGATSKDSSGRFKFQLICDLEKK